MSSIVPLEDAIADAGAGLLGGWAALRIVEPADGTAKLMVWGVGAAVGGGAMAFVDLRLQSSGNDMVKWAANNPLTFIGLAGLYTGLTKLAITLFLPEVELVPVLARVVGGVEVASGVMGALITGPEVGELLQDVFWLGGKALGIALPEPSNVADAGSFGSLPQIGWDTIKDIAIHEEWDNTLKPIGSDFIEAWRGAFVQHSAGEFFKHAFAMSGRVALVPLFSWWNFVHGAGHGALKGVGVVLKNVF